MGGRKERRDDKIYGRADDLISVAKIEHPFMRASILQLPSGPSRPNAPERK